MLCFLGCNCEGSADIEKGEHSSLGKSIDKAQDSSAGKPIDEAGGIVSQRITGCFIITLTSLFSCNFEGSKKSGSDKSSNEAAQGLSIVLSEFQPPPRGNLGFIVKCLMLYFWVCEGSTKSKQGEGSSQKSIGEAEGIIDY